MNKEFIFDDLKINISFNENETIKNLLILHIFNENDHNYIYDLINKDGINDTVFVTIYNVNEEDLLNLKIDERIKYVDTFDLIYKKIKEELGIDVKTYVIGYSLYGLLSTYLSYHVEYIDGFGGVSPSFWIDGVIDKLLLLKFRSNIKKCYLSIGDREAKGKRYFNVFDNINSYYNYLISKGFNCKFDVNNGNHFSDVYERIMKGIRYLLENN